VKRLLVVLVGAALLGGGAVVASLDGAGDEAEVRLASGDTGGSSDGDVLDRILVRDAPGNVVLRLFLDGAGASGPTTDPDFAICDLGASLVIEVSNRGAAMQQYASAFTTPEPIAMAAAQTFGEVEGDPAWFAVVRVADGVGAVRGLGDTAAVVDGWAILGGSGALPIEGSIEAVAGDDVVGSVAVSEGVERCYGPGEVPRLPAPGEQPPDPAAAEAAVHAAFHDAFDHRADPAAREEAVAHLEDVQSYMDRAAEAFPEAVATVTATVHELVFTAPDRAAVRFELSYTGGAEFGPQTGVAVLVDGRWRVERATMCMVLGWAGAGC
jgi:hypothetical protein